MGEEINFPQFDENDPQVRRWRAMSPYQQFKELGEDREGHGMSHYLQAELVAVHRAIYVLKQLEPGQTITYKALMERAVEYANQFPGIGAKYRDVGPRIEALESYGIVKFDGDPEDWEKTTVRLTAKGFLARPEEWYNDGPSEGEAPGFRPEMFEPYNYNPDGDWNVGPQYEDNIAEDVAFLRELERM